MEKRRDNGYELQWERFHLDVRNTFLTVRTIMSCNNVPRNMVPKVPLFPIARGFQDALESVLDNLI